MSHMRSNIGRIITFVVTTWVAATLSTAALPPSKVAWENDCTTTEGWFYNAYDPSTNGRVDKTADSVVKITQDGSGTWGKAFCTIDGISLNETPILEVKVDKVDADSAFQIAIAPPDWSEMLVIIKRTSAHGVHRGDVTKAIKKSKNKDAWKDTDSFHVVVIIEGKGKASYFDYVRLQSKM